jgi:hypothetical protein
MNPETEIESETDAFECPPLPADLLSQVDQLRTRREALFNLGMGSDDEAGELLLEMERTQRAWRESCESQWRREGLASARPPGEVVRPHAAAVPDPVRVVATPVASVTTEVNSGGDVRGSSSAGIGTGSGSQSQSKTKLAEYLELKTSEGKGEVPAGSAFAFWRKHKSQIDSDAHEPNSAYIDVRTAAGNLHRKLKK